MFRASLAVDVLKKKRIKLYKLIELFAQLPRRLQPWAQQGFMERGVKSAGANFQLNGVNSANTLSWFGCKPRSVNETHGSGGNLVRTRALC